MQVNFFESRLREAVKELRKSEHTTAFTGAGISVESGIPSFRGENGIWAKYNPIATELNYFFANPEESWRVIREIFYDFFGKAKPNAAHIALAEMEKLGYIDAVITQNIDNLHQDAGCSTVYEFHGNSQTLVCTYCGRKYPISGVDLSKLPPTCSDDGKLLKPDFIFFGEGIPQFAYQKSIEEAQNADVFLLVGTTGEVIPASTIPALAKRSGATIIEINPEMSNYTNNLTDIYLKGKAGKVLPLLLEELMKNDN